MIDLGLRLADIEQYGLEREAVHYKESVDSIRANLRQNGATEEEIAFLLTHRVELNAFTSDTLVEWVTSKLEEHGVQKVIPGEDVIAEAYRREHQSNYLKSHFGELVERSRKHVNDLDLPFDLYEQVTRRLEVDPTLSWDDAVTHIAKCKMDIE